MTVPKLVRCAVVLAAGFGGVHGTIHKVAAQQGEVSHHVASLVEQLGSTNYRDREKAHRKLAAMGPTVIPQVAAATGRSDLEIALRSRQLLRELRSDTMWSGTPIKLPPGRLPAREIIAAMEREAGVHLMLHRLVEEAADPQVQIEEGSSEFWPAVDLLCAQLEGSVRWQFDTCGTSALVGLSTRGHQAAASKGALRCEVVSLQPVRRLMESDGKPIGDPAWELTLRLMWEPKLHVVAVQRQPHVSLQTARGIRTLTSTCCARFDGWVHPADGLPCCTVTIPVLLDSTEGKLLGVRTVQWEVVAATPDAEHDRRSIRFEFDATGAVYSARFSSSTLRNSTGWLSDWSEM